MTPRPARSPAGPLKLLTKSIALGRPRTLSKKSNIVRLQRRIDSRQTIVSTLSFCRGSMPVIRKGRAEWRGTGRDGNGDLSTDSGVLDKTPYSFKTRFQNEKGTNPEELIAVAHAGCFTMALAFQLQTAGFTPTSLSTEAAVSLDPEGQAFKISKSALTLVAEVPGLDQATFDKLAEAAEKGCPVSKVLNAEITLTKTLK